MSRSRKAAKNAGTRMESLMAGYFNRTISDVIERRRQSGAKDRGDLSGVRFHGGRIVVEIKDTARVNLAGWAAEAEVERVNDNARVGVVVHKRHGNGNPADQWVTMTAENFVALVTGRRPDEADTEVS